MATWKTSKKTAAAKKVGFRSNFEWEIAKQLIWQKVKFEYEKLKLKYTPPVKDKTYTPDFVLPNGIVIEAKGYWTKAARDKMLWVIEQNPEYDIRMVFQNPSLKIRKNSKTTYAQWCDRKGIQWAFKSIPAEWIAEKPKTK